MRSVATETNAPIGVRAAANDGPRRAERNAERLTDEASAGPKIAANAGRRRAEPSADQPIDAANVEPTIAANAGAPNGAQNDVMIAEPRRERVMGTVRLRVSERPIGPPRRAMRVGPRLEPVMRAAALRERARRGATGGARRQPARRDATQGARLQPAKPIGTVDAMDEGPNGALKAAATLIATDGVVTGMVGEVIEMEDAAIATDAGEIAIMIAAIAARAPIIIPASAMAGAITVTVTGRATGMAIIADCMACSIIIPATPRLAGLM